MKRFLGVYIGTAEALERAGWETMSEATRRAREKTGIEAWKEWMIANRDSVVDAGGPLGTTRRISASGIADTSNDLVGYVIVQADSHEAAARLFREHPHFTVFPGDSVEVMECLPIPE